jgi:very-short-patch-repair endonuclease
MDVGACAARQHGLITSTDARACGLTVAQIKYRVRSGRWRRRHPGVFAVAGAPDTWEQRVMAAVLAAGHGAIASHTTAASLWGLPDSDRPPIVEVTVPRPRLPRLQGARVHRSLLLTDTDRVRVASIPVTSIPRTLVDLTAERGLGWIARSMDDSMRRNRTTITSIRECSDRLSGAPGRRPSVVRLLVAERLGDAALTESGFERVVLGVLRDAGLPAPEPQHPVAVGGRRYRLDFAWPEQRVALEADGFGPHSSYAAFHDDRRRDLALQTVGWRVLHVSDEMSAPTIVAAVSAALAR